MHTLDVSSANASSFPEPLPLGAPASTATEENTTTPDVDQHPSSASSAEGKENRKGLVGVLVTLGLMVKTLLLLLPKLKFASTGISMVISIGVYAIFFGWPFAVAFVLLLLVHEYGHVWQLRREGIEATAPMFIPLLGAFVGMKQMPADAASEARVGLAGPVVGSIGCLIPLFLWLGTGSDFWQAVTYTGFLINLFNLLPIIPLDGGRATAAISPKLWLIGFVAVLVLVVLTWNPILVLILLLGALEGWHRWKTRKTPEQQAYHQVPARQRLQIAAVYIMLVLVLGFATIETHLEPEQLQPTSHSE